MDNKENKPPLFKLKKSSKTVGGFDTNDENEWAFLVKHNYNDLPNFIHLRKMWNIVETPDELDADGNLKKKGIQQSSTIKMYSGFIKDGNFIVTNNQTIIRITFHDIRKAYINTLVTYTEAGYVKDDTISGTPIYYANERSPLVENTTQQGLSTAMAAVMPQSQGTINTSKAVKRPHLFLSAPSVLRNLDPNNNIQKNP